MRWYNGAVAGAHRDVRDLLGIERALIQAPVGSCATPELAAAVGEAGALGSLACTWTAPERIAPLIARVRALTLRPFATNLVLSFDVDAQLEALLAARVPVVTFSWGQPGPERIARCHAAGARAVVQAGSPAGARQACTDGADALIAQGVEAGGHVQSSTPLSDLLVAVLAEAAGTPVIAAGGLATRADIDRVRALGAAGAMLGTRFVACVESAAHDDYKAALVAAEASQTALTICFDGGWPHAQHRVLRNATLDRWEAAGCPGPGGRPDEDRMPVSRGGDGIPRYADFPPLAGDVGAVDEMCLYAGAGCGSIADVPAAAELVARLS